MGHGGPAGLHPAFTKRKEGDQSEVLFQIDRFHSFLWASGRLFSDFYIHFI